MLIVSLFFASIPLFQSGFSAIKELEYSRLIVPLLISQSILLIGLASLRSSRWLFIGLTAIPALAGFYYLSDQTISHFLNLGYNRNGFFRVTTGRIFVSETVVMFFILLPFRFHGWVYGRLPIPKQREIMIDALLDRLYAESSANDAVAVDRQQMMFNITPGTGKFLDLLVAECRPRRILEIGTSNGYSTIWLARAAKKIGATIDTVDHAEMKTRVAMDNLEDAGLLDVVTCHTADAGKFLDACLADTYDFVFLDSDRSRYTDWAPSLIKTIRFGILVVDNATSHPDEMMGFRSYLDEHTDLDSVVLPIGKGELVIRPKENS